MKLKPPRRRVTCDVFSGTERKKSTRHGVFRQAPFRWPESGGEDQQEVKGAHGRSAAPTRFVFFLKHDAKPSQGFRIMNFMSLLGSNIFTIHDFIRFLLRSKKLRKLFWGCWVRSSRVPIAGQSHKRVEDIENTRHQTAVWSIIICFPLFAFVFGSI